IPRTCPLFTYTTLFRSTETDNQDGIRFVRYRWLRSGNQCRFSLGFSVPRSHAANNEQDIVCPAACRRVRIRCGSNLPNGIYLHRSEEHTSELQSPDHLV